VQLEALALGVEHRHLSGAVAGELEGRGAEGQAEHVDRVGEGARRRAAQGGVVLREVARDGGVRGLGQGEGRADLDAGALGGRLDRQLARAARVAQDRAHVADHVVVRAGLDRGGPGVAVDVDSGQIPVAGHPHRPVGAAGDTHVKDHRGGRVVL
jgi:hypothetical protein